MRPRTVADVGFTCRHGRGKESRHGSQVSQSESTRITSAQRSHVSERISGQLYTAPDVPTPHVLKNSG